MYDEAKTEAVNVRRSEVSEWLSNLEKEIAATRQALDGLQKKLAPVLRQKCETIGKDGGPSPPQQTLVPIANSLRGACEQLRKITSDAVSTRDLVEV